MKTILALIFALAMLAVTGCATTDYDSYAKAQADIATAKANSDTARYNALSEIAKTGTESSKIAAVMALALGTGGAAQAQQVAAPQASSALQWAQVLVPGLTQIAGISANMRLGMVQSDNGAKIAVSTNEAFTGIAGKIQAPAANITTTDSHNTDNHTVTPAPVVTTPIVVAPSTKVCTLAPTTNVLTCQ